MTAVRTLARRGAFVAALSAALAALGILLAAWPAHAGTVTDACCGYSFTTAPTEGQTAPGYNFTRPASSPGDLALYKSYVCALADGTSPDAVSQGAMSVNAWPANTALFANVACTSPKVAVAIWHSVLSERGHSTVLRWESVAWRQRGTYNATTTNVIVSPSPYASASPVPVYLLPSAYPAAWPQPLKASDPYPAGWPAGGSSSAGGAVLAGHCVAPSPTSSPVDASPAPSPAPCSQVVTLDGASSDLVIGGTTFLILTTGVTAVGVAVVAVRR